MPQREVTEGAPEGGRRPPAGPWGFPGGAGLPPEPPPGEGLACVPSACVTGHLRLPIPCCAWAYDIILFTPPEVRIP